MLGSGFLVIILVTIFPTPTVCAFEGIVRGDGEVTIPETTLYAMGAPSTFQETQATNMNWPWMTESGAKFRVPPILPVDDLDERPSVKDLIQGHRKPIEVVRAEIQEEEHYNVLKHDDLWILRFLLTHDNKTKPAVKAAKATLQFRAEHNLDERDLRSFPLDKNAPPNEAVQRYLQHCQDDALSFVVPDAKRGVIAFFRPAGVDQNALVEQLDEAEWMKMFFYITEWTFQWLDYTTRTTGRLTKLVRLVDMNGFTMSQQMNREAQRRHAKVARVVEVCYPQIDESFFLLNTPLWIRAPLQLLRPLFPKRLVEKVDLIDPAKRKKDLAKILKFVSKDNLPERFGGKNQAWPVEQHTFD